MSPDQVVGMIALIGWLILVGSGIWRRGEPAGKIAKQAAIWVAIIGILWLVATFGLTFAQLHLT
jgi:hypothetical protein